MWCQRYTSETERNPLPLRISAVVALAGGIVTPLLETIRRWEQLHQLRYFITWFDDYLIGGFLFFSAWSTLRSPHNGQRYLVAAWGFALGMSFYSFFSQLQQLDRPDPAPVSPGMIALVKGGMFIACIVCLVLAMRRISTDNAGD
jgi:hypothetical protein